MAFFLIGKFMGKTFKSLVSFSYGSNMNHIANYANTLPARKKEPKLFEDVSEGSLNAKFELAKKYFLWI